MAITTNMNEEKPCMRLSPAAAGVRPTATPPITRSTDRQIARCVCPGLALACAGLLMVACGERKAIDLPASAAARRPAAQASRALDASEAQFDRLARHAYRAALAGDRRGLREAGLRADDAAAYAARFPGVVPFGTLVLDSDTHFEQLPESLRTYRIEPTRPRDDRWRITFVFENDPATGELRVTALGATQILPDGATQHH
jgi:hypothetical protein